MGRVLWPMPTIALYLPSTAQHHPLALLALATETRLEKHLQRQRQVPSTTHLDSLLVCKARGFNMRQIVLLRPCALLHQSHPAPVTCMRYVHPGWHFSHDLCSRKTQEARDWLARDHGTRDHDTLDQHVHCVGDQTQTCQARSMDANWGYPHEVLQETRVPPATPDDWQWFALGLDSVVSKHPSKYPSHPHTQDPSHDSNEEHAPLAQDHDADTHTEMHRDMQTDIQIERDFRLVFCVATTPERVGAMEQVLDSLLLQTHAPDVFYVSLIRHVPLPDFLETKVKAGQVQILRNSGEACYQTHSMWVCDILCGYVV
jgi:hypothetical protein